MTRLTEAVLRHKLIVVAFWLLAAFAGIATLNSTTTHLSSNFSLPGQQGYLTDRKIAAIYHNGGGQQPTVVTLTAPTGSHGNPAVAHRVFTAAAAAVPGVRLADAVTTGDAHFATNDGRTSFALLFPPPNTGFGADTRTPAIRSAAAHAAPAGWHVGVTGFSQLAAGSSSGKGTSVMVEAMLGGLGALAVLAFVFGSLLAFVPLLMAMTAIPSTFLLINGLEHVTSVSMLVEFLVALIGLGVAIDYSLLVVTRWREARDNGSTNVEAVRESMRHGGHAVVFSGITVAIS